MPKTQHILISNMMLQICLVRNNVMGFEFLTPPEEYPEKIDGDSTLWLEPSKGTQRYDRVVPREQNRGWQVDVKTHVLPIHTQKTAVTSTILFRAIGTSPYHMENSALPPSSPPGDEIPHASRGCPAQTLLLFYCALFLVLLLLKYSPLRYL